MEHKIILKKIQYEDLEEIMIWRTSPEVTRFFYTDPMLDITKQEEWYYSIQNNEHCKYWMITVGNKAVGILGLTNIDLLTKECGLTWYIADKEYKGKGIGKTIQLNLIEYVFNKLKFVRFYSEVFSFNKGAINLHLKCGLEIEGTMKEHIFKNGEFYDVVIMSITESRWKKIKSEYQFDEVVFEE